MKTLLCLILLAPTVLLRAGEIDQLQTQQDVERFVRKIDKNYGKIRWSFFQAPWWNTIHTRIKISFSRG